MIGSSPADIKTIGIIGAGTIGASWAAYFLATGKGHLAASLEVARSYLYGDGVSPDADLALKLLNASADRGSAAAMFLLGRVYDEGIGGVAAAPSRALGYYGRAAERDHAQAAVRLAALERRLNMPASVEVAARESDDVALIIEIGRYTRSPVIPDVRPAAADAARIRAYFTGKLGIRPENILHLKNPTSGELVEALGNERSHKGRLHDMVRDSSVNLHVYYVGHGVPGEGGEGAYLVPGDARAGKFELLGYPLDLLYRNLARIPARTRTVVLEACFSGASPAGSLFANASPVFVATDRPAPPPGITLYAAGAADQIASWSEDGGHSLFTRHFVEGMSGAADGNGDGRVAPAELRRYLSDTVTYQARRLYGRTQEPQVHMAAGG